MVRLSSTHSGNEKTLHFVQYCIANAYNFDRSQQRIRTKNIIDINTATIAKDATAVESPSSESSDHSMTAAIVAAPVLHSYQATSLPGALEHPILQLSDEKFRNTPVSEMFEWYGQSDGGGSCPEDFGYKLIGTLFTLNNYDFPLQAVAGHYYLMDFTLFAVNSFDFNREVAKHETILLPADQHHQYSIHYRHFKQESRLLHRLLSDPPDTAPRGRRQSLCHEERRRGHAIVRR